MFLGFVGVSVLLLVIGVAANNKEKTIRKSSRILVKVAASCKCSAK
jgi:ABC-type molybdate transport system substrate-binding protein